MFKIFCSFMSLLVCRFVVIVFLRFVIVFCFICERIDDIFLNGDRLFILLLFCVILSDIVRRELSFFLLFVFVWLRRWWVIDRFKFVWVCFFVIIFLVWILWFIRFIVEIFFEWRDVNWDFDIWSFCCLCIVVELLFMIVGMFLFLVSEFFDSIFWLNCLGKGEFFSILVGTIVVWRRFVLGRYCCFIYL